MTVNAPVFVLVLDVVFRIDRVPLFVWLANRVNDVAVIAPPTYNPPTTPIPPATVNAPVVVDVLV